jgi:hypothetical protein
MKRLAILCLAACAFAARGMDRLPALSMLETGNNDSTVGRRGEISRFQILPSVWRRYGAGNPLNPRDATLAVRRIMAKRLANFERSQRRQATNFDYYVLWNAPAQAGRPSPVVSERARRFANLCSK